jgi:small subunit ribosomal protein S1
MVDRSIISKLGLSHEQIEAQVDELFTEEHSQLLEEALDKKVDTLVPGTILSGRIVTRLGNNVIVELGLKSEGIVDASEFDDPEEIAAGRELEVLLEEVDAEGGILLSKRKADRIRGWERIVTTTKEGDLVKGRVTRRIKGGLLIDIGVPVFLPASQVDIRKPGDISRFIGQQIECKILKIDSENRNIVVSRRKIIEEERSSSKEKLLKEIEVGQLRKGIVKNIADFGVFVDLGGLDGLLHISDLSWGRISHPSEVVRLDQEVECIVIGFNRENEKISLGLKQKAKSPWETVEQCYPIGSRVKGTVVNIMNYGAFIRLEEGIEGLVHISEMSWTRRIIHPADILNLNDEIEVVVLDLKKDRQEISLGIKQLETNPWTIAAQKYPPGTIVTTRVTSLMNYGAFVEIEPGVDGLIHISDLSWTRKYNHPGDALEKGHELKCVVLEVNEEKHRVSLGIKQMTEDPWIRAIPEKYIPGQVVKGRVTKLTNFGVFVELEPDLEGLLHISELADHKVDSPKDVVNTEEEIEVKILRVDSDSRKIGLSLRRVRWAAEDAASKDKPRRRGGLDGRAASAPDAVAGAGKDKRKEKQKKQPPQAKEEKQEIKEEKKEEIEPKQEQPQEEKKEEPEQQPPQEAEGKEQEAKKQPEQPEQEPGPVEEQQPQEEPEDKEQQKLQAEEEQTPADEQEVAEQPEQEQPEQEQPEQEQPEQEQPQEEKKEEPEQQPTKEPEDKEQDTEKQPESSAEEEGQKVAEPKEDAKEAEGKEQEAEKQPEQSEQEPEPVEEQQPQEKPEDKEQQESQAKEEQPPAQKQDVAEQPEQEQKKNQAQKKKKKKKKKEKEKRKRARATRR